VERLFVSWRRYPVRQRCDYGYRMLDTCCSRIFEGIVCVISFFLIKLLTDPISCFILIITTELNILVKSAVTMLSSRRKQVVSHVAFGVVVLLDLAAVWIWNLMFELDWDLTISMMISLLVSGCIEALFLMIVLCFIKHDMLDSNLFPAVIPISFLIGNLALHSIAVFVWGSILSRVVGLHSATGVAVMVALMQAFFLVFTFGSARNLAAIRSVMMFRSKDIDKPEVESKSSIVIDLSQNSKVDEPIDGSMIELERREKADPQASMNGVVITTPSSKPEKIGFIVSGLAMVLDLTIILVFVLTLERNLNLATSITIASILACIELAVLIATLFLVREFAVGLLPTIVLVLVLMITIILHLLAIALYLALSFELISWTLDFAAGVAITLAFVEAVPLILTFTFLGGFAAVKYVVQVIVLWIFQLQVVKYVVQVIVQVIALIFQVIKCIAQIIVMHMLLIRAKYEIGSMQIGVQSTLEKFKGKWEGPPSANTSSENRNIPIMVQVTELTVQMMKCIVQVVVMYMLLVRAKCEIGSTIQSILGEFSVKSKGPAISNRQTSTDPQTAAILSDLNVILSLVKSLAVVCIVSFVSLAIPFLIGDTRFQSVFLSLTSFSYLIQISLVTLFLHSYAALALALAFVRAIGYEGKQENFAPDQETKPLLRGKGLQDEMEKEKKGKEKEYGTFASDLQTTPLLQDEDEI
jgi:hypothetical protein